MNETLISLETAKLAKEKGYDRIKIVSKNNIEADYNAHTHSLLQQQLREVHDLSIERCSESSNDFLDNSNYWSIGVYSLITKLPVDSISSDKLFDSYEEALESGLLNALQLIK